jgi:hypothetical protein
MQAAAGNLAVMDRYFAAGPVTAELRLMAWRPLAVLRPALMGSLRLGMGAGVGAGFGAVSGHYGLWVAAGMVLGAALNAVAGYWAPAPGAAPPAPMVAPAAVSGPYRIH